jgi:predicted SnoaL-like aldol condensation-catalyzing enzyme
MPNGDNDGEDGMSAMQDEALVRRAVEEIWNAGRLDIADELFAPDFVHHGGLIPDLVGGPETIKFSVVLYRRAFPTLHITVEDVLATGEMVTLHWTARGSHLPDADGNARAEAEAGLAGVTRSRVTGGKIAESWTDWNRDQAFRRMSLVGLDGASS